MSKFKTARVSKITAILLMLFSISVLISQSLMDLFSTLLCLYLILHWGWAKQQGMNCKVVPKMGFDWLWVVWFTVATSGFVLNTPPADTPEKFWLLRLAEFKWVLILYFMVGALHLTKTTSHALTIFQIAAMICALYGLGTYAIEVQANPGQGQRLGGIYQFSMTHAHVYGIVFCFLLGLVQERFQNLTISQKSLSLATLSAVGTSVLLTYTRGMWIGVTVSVITISFLWRPRNGFIALLACPLLAGGLYILIPNVKNRIDFTAKLANSEETKKSYDSERLVLWKTNLMIFKDHPWFGTGYGQNKFYLREYYEKQGLPKNQFIGHAHNQYLHLLAGTGILGLLCYLGLLATIALKTFKAFLKIPKTQNLHKSLALGSLGGQIAFAVGGLTESNFEHSKVRFAVMFMWALGLWLWKEHENAR